MNPTYNDINLTHNQVLATVQELSKSKVIPLDEEIVTNINTVSMGTEKSECKSDLQFDLSASDLTEIQKQHLQKFLVGYRDLFSADLSELGKTSLYKHKIETFPGSKPDRKQFYRTSPQTAKEIRRQVDEMLKHDTSSSLRMLSGILQLSWLGKRMDR